MKILLSLIICIILLQFCAAFAYYTTDFSQSWCTCGWSGKWDSGNDLGTISIGWGPGGYSGEDCLYIYVNKTSTVYDSADLCYYNPPFVLGTDTIWSIYAALSTSSQPAVIYTQLYSLQGPGWIWACPGHDNASTGSGPLPSGVGGFISKKWNQYSFYRNDTTLGSPMGHVGIQFNLSTMTGTFIFKVDKPMLGPSLPWKITSLSKLHGAVNFSFNLPLQVTGGIPPYHWSTLSGNLPPGLSLNPKGELWGVPSTQGYYEFTFQVTDSRSSTLTQKMSFTVSHWTKVWADEFDYSGAPDSTKWTYNLGDLGWNQESQYYTNNPENVHVNHGTLILEARNTSYREHQYTSAFIKTQGLAYWKYGRFEMRAKLPQGRGVWPAFWMLSDNYIYGHYWPNNGEIDILENVGWNPDTCYGSVHNGFNVNGLSSINQTGTISIPGMETSFHTYTVEWYPDVIYWYVDNTVYAEYSDNTADWRTWPYNQPFYLLINLAVGGNLGTNNGQYSIDNSIFPQQMIVDYVRVYQSNPAKNNLLTHPSSP